MGAAYSVWNVIQNNKGYFGSLRASDPNYRLLPASKFTDAPDSHSKDVGDMLRLKEAIETSRQ